VLKLALRPIIPAYEQFYAETPKPNGQRNPQPDGPDSTPSAAAA
jgi:hypothetical protein